MTTAASSASSTVGITDIAAGATDTLREVSDRYGAWRRRRRLRADLRSARRRRAALREIAYYRDNFALGAFGRLA